MISAKELMAYKNMTESRFIVKALGFMAFLFGNMIKPFGKTIKGIGNVIKPFGKTIKGIGNVIKPFGNMIKGIGDGLKGIGKTIKPIGLEVNLLPIITKVPVSGKFRHRKPVKHT